MTTTTAAKTLLQAYIELRAEDPEATSALTVARERLAAGRSLRALRRVRVFELLGELPARAEVEALLHRSTRFYNPAKERCTLRASASDPAPFRAEEALVLVVDRGLERRTAAERWWKHETGAKVEVREGTAWALEFEVGTDATAAAAALAAVGDRAHGLLSNPHFQDWRPGPGAAPPWPWVHGRPAPVRARKRTTKGASS
ncbi:MAG: hypothetical protein ABL977_16020 [Candidatus Eisenbacteria bacterium]